MIKRVLKGVLLPLLVAGFSVSAFAEGEHHKHWKKMDANGDGQISASEHANASQARFHRMDRNQDGMLSKKEMRKAHKKMKEMREKHHEKDSD